jgi:hypothetical protein
VNRRVTWSDLLALGAAFPLFDWVSVHGGTFAGVLVGLFLAQYVLSTWVVLLHELGHAIVALVLTPHRVAVHIGDRPGARFRIGRLDVSLSLDSSSGHFGMPVEALTRGQAAAIALAGPLVSLALVVPFALASIATVDTPLVAVIFAALALQATLGALNLVPLRDFAELPGAEIVPGMTDGMVAVLALQGRSGADLWWGDDDPETLALNSFSPAARDVIEGARSRGGGTLELLRGLAGPEGGFAQKLLAERGILPDFTARLKGRPESHAAMARAIRRASDAVAARKGEFVDCPDLLFELLSDPRCQAARLIDRRHIDAVEFKAAVATEIAADDALHPTTV